MDPAIWARSLVEGVGNESAVKAAYVKLRVAQLNAAAEAEAKRIIEEKEKANQSQKNAATDLDEQIKKFASDNKLKYFDAALLLVYGISRTADRYVLTNKGGHPYCYEKLEDAISYATFTKRCDLHPILQSSTTWKAARVSEETEPAKVEEECRQPGALAVQEEAEAKNRQGATIIAARAKAEEEERAKNFIVDNYSKLNGFD